MVWIQLTLHLTWASLTLVSLAMRGSFIPEIFIGYIAYLVLQFGVHGLLGGVAVGRRVGWVPALLNQALVVGLILRSEGPAALVYPLLLFAGFPAGWAAGWSTALLLSAAATGVLWMAGALPASSASLLSPAGFTLIGVVLGTGALGGIGQILGGMALRSIQAKALRHERMGQLIPRVGRLGSEGDLGEVLSAGLSLVGEVMEMFDRDGQQGVGWALYQPVGASPLIRSTWREAGSEPEVGGDVGLIAAVRETRTTASTQEPESDPNLLRLPPFLSCSVVYCIPMLVEGKPRGFLMAGHFNSEVFNEAALALMEAVVETTTRALHDLDAYQRLNLEMERITEIQEEARKKLARSLHDGPTQTIAAIAMQLNYARRLVNRDKDKAEDELMRMEEIARQTTREIRHMLFTLRPLILESQGLVAALHQLAVKVQTTHGDQVIVEAEPGAAEDVDENIQAVLFYIAEEAITNACKHAEAEHIWVRLDRLGDSLIELKVQDDGVGFNVGAVDAHYEQRGSLGMVNMRERAELIRGTFRIESAQGKGTYISVVAPLNGSQGFQLKGESTAPE